MSLLSLTQNTTFGMRFIKILPTILLLIITLPVLGQSIWTNPITGTNPGQTTPWTSGDVKDANITVSGISRTGVTGNDANDRYNARGWNSSAITNRYFEFTLTPSAGYRIDFSSFEYTGQKSATGPVNFALRSSADSYGSNIGTATVNGTTISLSAAAYQNITAPITFRLYAWTASAAGGTFSVNDFTFNGSVNATCASVPLTSVLPTNGPAGTEVTITAAAGLTGATATFSGITAPIVSSTDTQLVVTVPAGATTGNLIVRNAALCASTSVAFTVINTNLTACGGSTIPGELFISEVTDSNYGSLTYVEIFNGTGTTKLLSNYSIRIASNGGGYTAGNTVTLSGVNLPSGSSFVLALGVDATVCSSPGGDGSYADQQAAVGVTSVNFTTNQHDHIALFNGSTQIDSWGTFGATSWAPAAIGANGATFRRKNNVSPLPDTNYDNADWDIIDYAGSGSSFCANNDYTNVGTFATFKTPPTVTVNPSVSLSCTTVGITLTATGTEGVAGGVGIAYQWYYLAPASNVWTVVPNTGIYSGATSGTLSISSIATVNNYQYYCQVREDSATCYSATTAVIIKDIYSTTWTSALAWSNGLPSLTKRAIIDETYNTATNGSFEACSLTVNAAKNLTITPSEYVVIQNNLTVNGTLTVQDDGSLVQISNTGINTGNITVGRDVNIRKFDYVYWSAPVANFAVTAVSPGTASNYIYKWNPTQAGSYGIWVGTGENMVPGKGYIIRGPSAWPTTFSLFSASFSGVPNNGVITPSIQRGSYTGGNYTNPNGVIVTNQDDNWNLIGNPYPSAIRALDFLNANTNIEGAVRLWTHGSLPSAVVTDPFYGNFLYNYNSNDYIVYNGTGTVSGPAGFNGYIASGQGFFVQMNDGAAATQTVTFNNSMRNRTYGNGQFYRQASVVNNRAEGTTGESSRIWLDLIGPDQMVSRTLVGYVDGATLEKDRLYDAYGKRDNNLNFYSLIGEDAMAIQGRPLPFDDNDRVPLGLHLAAGGSYKIGVAAVDGLFGSNAISVLLEDKALGVTHDLRQAPYTFAAAAGMLDDRFVLRYATGSLGNVKYDAADNQLVIAVSQGRINIKSAAESIQKAAVYDLLGREIFSRENVNDKELSIDEISARQQAVLVKLTLANGQQISKKVLL